MLNLKKNILMIITMMLIIIAFMVPTKVHASDGQINVISLDGTPTPSATATQKPTQTSTPAPATATTKATATPSGKLPQTGIEDYTGLIIATIVLGGIAVFSYMKIREYDKF